MKHIAVFTSSRSDWGILETLVREMRQACDMKTSVIATGSHFDARFGLTIDAFSSEYSNLLVRLDAGPVGNTPEEAAAMAGRVTELVGKWLAESTPDAVIVLGDRFEALACGLAAAVHNTPLIHLHGGEMTTGAIDDSIRHAISKLSHMHFPVHEDYRRRLVQLGENPDSIFVTGSIALENLDDVGLKSRVELASHLDCEIPDEYFVCALHPVTTNSLETEAILSSLEHVLLEEFNFAVFFTAPAPDPGFELIRDAFSGWSRKVPSRFFYRETLGMQSFLSLVAGSAGLVGNSSSGILEVPSLGVPTLNIGTRQLGRVRAYSVVDSGPDVGSIRASFLKILSEDFKSSLINCTNPYQGTNPSKTVVERLQRTNFRQIKEKHFVDLGGSP